MKKRVLLTSLLTIALCFSLMFGATYALFTSESKVNIAVTSGKVEVEASVSKVELFSMDVLQAATFENGGTATIEGAELKLDRMTPGDKAVITINVKNNSNIKTIWRFVYECAEGIDLMSGMVVSINDTVYGAVKDYNSAWAELSGDKEVKISFELPVEAGNEYQGLAAKISFKVEAVQGNAGYADPENVTYIAKVEGQAGLEEAIAAGKGTVILSEGTYKLPAAVSGKTVEIIGNGETEIDATAAQGFNGADITLTDVVVKGTNDNYKGFQHTEKVVYNNCVFNNGNFLYANEVEFYNCEFNLTSQYIWTYGAGNVLFKDCVFNTEGKAVLVYKEGSDVDQVVTFEDCEFYASKGAYTWDGQHVAAIEIDGSLPNGGEGTFTVNLKGEMVLDPEFQGLCRVKKDASPSNVTVNNEATVKEVNLVFSEEEFSNAIHADKEVINIVLANSIETKLTGGVGTANTKEVNISALSKDMQLVISTKSDSYQGSYVTYRTVNPNAVINFSNVTLDKSAWTANTWNTYNIEFYTNVTLTNCVVNHPVTFCEKAEVVDTIINGYRDTADHYAVWVCVGANVNIKGGEINGTRGIKADNEYSTASLENTVLVVEGTKFATTSSKPAILVKMINAEITVSNADIANVAADSVNPVWIDEDCPTTGTIKVTVDGAVKDNASINEKVLG